MSSSDDEDFGSLDVRQSAVPKARPAQPAPAPKPRLLPATPAGAPGPAAGPPAAKPAAPATGPFVLSRSTVAALTTPDPDDDIQRIVDAVVETFPELEAPEKRAVLPDWCETAIERGRRHGVESEYGVYVWLCAMALFGREFDADPQLDWTRDALDEAFDEEAIVALLELRILMEAGVEV